MNERTHKDGFLPSLELTKKYWEFYEKEVPKDKVITREEMIKGVEFMGRYIKVTEEEIRKAEQNILGDNLMGAIISYTNDKSEENEKNLKGLVVKLTENNSFNKEFLNRYNPHLSLWENPNTPELYQALHKEFLEYAKENPERFHYANMRVNENDEIEFYDFKKSEPLPDLDKIMADKSRWKTS